MKFSLHIGSAYPPFNSCRGNFTPIYELHINRRSRKRYGVDDTLFESSGNVIFPNYRAVRELTLAFNKKNSIPGRPDTVLRAGTMNAIGLLDEIGHFLVRVYDEVENPQSMHRAYLFVEQAIGKASLEKTLSSFLQEFPPKDVYKNHLNVGQYMETSPGGRHSKEIALEEMTMLYLSNANPGFNKVKELFSDASLRGSSSYVKIVSLLEDFFAKEKPFGPEQQTLLQALKASFHEHPDSVSEQLRYFKNRWGILLSEKLLEKIDGSLVFSKEEEEYLWRLTHQGGQGDVETFVPDYKSRLTAEERERLRLKGLLRPEDYLYEEPERFTPDIDWMPNVVLIAKNTYVWLDQLSKHYGRSIKRLDEIPDEELDRLREWHFTGLWLIGVWERSHASKKIKQINGNLDAVSSAYSLFDYEIASDLGGEEAFQNLNRRAWERGIRLAGDMVPNHMGLYSKWIIEHPDYFIQSDRPPYPSYQFTGPDLSDDPNIELKIEDGYWRKDDAAVVFRRIDKRYNDVRFIYHGNDGTNMPWNDTAQLNLLRADVRESVIQSILHVARKFSIIRFDAAMTLAKKHFQRLWYPMPGTSGVPSRQDHSMSRTDFDQQFPVEFWREVVDRFNHEMPQTLLLAEAFWLMEGYFVRTLGMHRVYNSAFMHMMMKEENSKYRSLIRNTLEFNPEILKRYVNFMSNPDEETAIAQFGKDDKYFGVATMMVTLPGLPMIAHGQVEGYTEKYGMEYQRAYYNEKKDDWLVRRHEQEIFPLMEKRYLFSQVHNFELYDYHDDRGFVNEEVFAYSNIAGDERGLVVFHNKYSEAKGRIKMSVPKVRPGSSSVHGTSLGDALHIQYSENIFYRCRERKSNCEYLFRGKDLHDHGLWFDLKAFQYAVFTDFTEIYDDTGVYSRTVNDLNGGGSTHIDVMLAKHRLQPFYTAFRNFGHSLATANKENVLSEYSRVVHEFTRTIRNTSPPDDSKEQFMKIFVSTLRYAGSGSKKQQPADNSDASFALCFWMLSDLDNLLAGSMNGNQKKSLIEEYHLHDILFEILGEYHANDEEARNRVALLAVLLTNQKLLKAENVSTEKIVDELFDQYDAADFIHVNQHNGIWYFNKEQFELMTRWVLSFRFIYYTQPIVDEKRYTGKAIEVKKEIDIMHSVAAKSGYRVEKFKEFFSSKKLSIKGEKVERKPVKKSVKKS